MTIEDFRNLTEEQAEFLIALAKTPHGIGPEPVFRVRYSGAGVRITARSPVTGETREFSRSRAGTLATLKLFDRMGFIQLREDLYTFPSPMQDGTDWHDVEISFVLRQKSYDYLEWTQLSPLSKGWRAFSENWASDLRAGIISVIVTLLTYLVTTLIAKSCSSSVFSSPVPTP